MKTYEFVREADPSFWRYVPYRFNIGDQVQEFIDLSYDYLKVVDHEYGPVRTIGVCIPGGVFFRVPATWLKEI